ncbi:MAG: hypothetical protein CVU39_07720 [Chloroflexi bacterium HGW-Chloroflexi-10]|nr:MAG: hypothetical protein CVU39_07720 [Chloroflexi bacterium HGW-Chloroflexi-10]
MGSETFDYRLDLPSTWPPKGHPKPPFGPSALEIMRSCPLRSCFDASDGYERRLGFAARIGTVFHRTIQSFYEQPIPKNQKQQIAEEARQHFLIEYQKQIAESAKHPRERGLPIDQTRVDRAIEAIIAEALRINQEGFIYSSKSLQGRMDKQTVISPFQTEVIPNVEVEVPVNSGDGILSGRIDRVEHRRNETWLFDYKSAIRDDLPGRYERQLQLYAYMWNKTRNEWPTEAHVLYPLTGSVHRVPISEEICQQIYKDTVLLITQVEEASTRSELAIPGDTCQICDFRPWCQPFWKWQSQDASLTSALEKATLGFEGEIKEIGVVNYNWRLLISWRNSIITLKIPQERFPQLKNAKIGTKIRVLDSNLRGLRHQPQAQITEISELFIIIG